MHLSWRERASEQRLRRKLAIGTRTSPVPGIAACVILTCLAAVLHNLSYPPFTTSEGRQVVSEVLLALLLGMILGNVLPLRRTLSAGVDFTVKKLLPVGIILLGARLDFYDLIEVSLSVLVGAILNITIVILLTRFLARLLKVETRLGLLIGIGTAICGSSAIVAAAPVVEAEEEDIAFSIATINLLGVLAMLVFPLLGALLQLEAGAYGVWCGLSIHATPQVVAAGFAHHSNGQFAGEIATIVKLTRISLLGPTIFVIGALYARRRRQETFVPQTIHYSRLIPGFVVFFLAMAFLRTMGCFPEVTFHMTDRFILGEGDRTLDLASLLGLTAHWVITGAMAGVGLMTDVRSMRSGGVKSLLLGLLAGGAILLLGLIQAGL